MPGASTGLGCGASVDQMLVTRGRFNDSLTASTWLLKLLSRCNTGKGCVRVQNPTGVGALDRAWAEEFIIVILRHGCTY